MKLSSFSVVTFDESAKFFFTPHTAFCLRLEVNIKHVVIDALSPMRSFRVVVSDPSSVDIIQLLNAETHKVIKAFTFVGTDE